MSQGIETELSYEVPGRLEGSSSEVKRAIKNYVAQLADQMALPAENLTGVSGIPTAEKLARLVEKTSDSAVQLSLRSKRSRSSVFISSETKITPDMQGRNAQIALLLEAAARHRVVANSTTEKTNFLDKLAQMNARSRVKKFEKEAEALIQESTSPKTRRILQASSVLMLAAAACGATFSVIPPVDGGSRTTEVSSSPDIDPTIKPTIESTPTAEPAPASLESQMSLLKPAGYKLQHSAEGWELLDRNGKSVLISKEAATITIIAENGDELLFPAEDFEVKKTIGAGVDFILTVKNPEGKVDHFFLDKEGSWVTPIEQQTDPNVIENYTQVELNDLWDGRMLYSEMLNAQQFPEGTIVPDYFTYWLTNSPTGFYVMLQDVVNGLPDVSGDSNLKIHSDNDYRRYINFSRSQTPSGVEVVIGTEQVLMPDGKTSLFLHYVYGQEWPWDKDIKYGSHQYNLIDSVFLKNTTPAKPNHVYVAMRPVIFFETFDPDLMNKWGGIVQSNPDTAGTELYKLPQNKPVTILPNFENTIHEMQPQLPWDGQVTKVGSEIDVLQYMGLLSTWAYTVSPDYFNPSK